MQYFNKFDGIQCVVMVFLCWSSTFNVTNGDPSAWQQQRVAYPYLRNSLPIAIHPFTSFNRQFIDDQLMANRQTNQLAVGNNWKLSDFLSDDDFMNDRIAEILVRRHETNGGHLNFSSKEEMLAFIITELTRMAVFQTDFIGSDSRQISFSLSGFGPFLTRIGQNLANRIQTCRAILVNIAIPGCFIPTTTTTTTTAATTAITPPPCGEPSLTAITDPTITVKSPSHPSLFSWPSSFTCTYTITASSGLSRLGFRIDAGTVLGSGATVKMYYADALSGGTSFESLVNGQAEQENFTYRLDVRIITVVFESPANVQNKWSIEFKARNS